MKWTIYKHNKGSIRFQREDGFKFNYGIKKIVRLILEYDEKVRKKVENASKT